MWAVRQDLVTSVEEPFVEHLFEGPPSRFDVIVVQGHVGVVEVNPVRHAFGHLSPGGFVRPNGFSAGLVELRHAKGFDGLVAHEIQSLLHLDFNREAVGVPSAFSLHEKPFHRFPSADEVFVGPSDDVVNSRFSVGRRWAFKENKRGVVSTTVNRCLEGLFRRPLLKQSGFQTHGVQFTCRRRLSHDSPTKVAVLNTTPHFVHFSEVSAFAAVSENRNPNETKVVAKKTEGASFKSFDAHHATWRVGDAMQGPLVWWSFS